MTDIVERLREGVFGSDETKTDTVIHAHMQVAADEIERLRAECQRLAAEVSRAHRDALAWMERAAAARREGIEAAAERARSLFAEGSIGHDTVPAAIRALLEDGR